MKKNLLILILVLFGINNAISQELKSDYSFDDGTANDQIGGNEGVNSGATLTEDRFGNPDRAMYFDGSATIEVSDSIDTDLNNMKGLSISCWIKSNNLNYSDLTAIVSRWTGKRSSEQYGLFQKSNNHLFALGVVAPNGIDLNGGIDTAWTHVVVTYSNIFVKYYIDGKFSGASLLTSPFPGTSGFSKLYIGSQSGTSRFYVGSIDDVKIYDDELDDKAILALYEGLDPVGINDEVILKSDYSFDDGTANDQIGDNEGLNNGATLTEDRFGNSDMAMYFDGSATIEVSDSIDTDLNNMKGLSISCWTKSNNLNFSGLTAIVSRWTGNSTTEQYGLFQKSNNHLFALGVVAPDGVDLNGDIDTAWTHVVVTYSNTFVKYYIDGKFSGASLLNKPFPGTSGFAKLYIGSQSGASRFFIGSIDDIKIYDDELDDKAILALYEELGPVGIADEVLNAQISLYPNPVTVQLNISSNEEIRKIEVNDLTGKTLMTIKNPNNTVDVALLAKGVYLLQMYTTKGVSNRRFIKD